MSNTNSELTKYKNVNLVSYINEKFPTYEKSVIQMEKDKISSIKSNMENEIFKIFLQNSDSLLDILYSYESVFTKLQDIKDITYHTSFVSERVVNVNKKKLSDFKSVLQNFTTDLSSFDTGERTLEYFDFLGSYIFLMTNDILIIGKKLGRKYTLINTFNYSVIDIKTTDNLIIKMGETEMVFEGDKDKIMSINEKFIELSYDYENSVSSEIEIVEDDEDLRNYYVETERFNDLTSKGMSLKIDECKNFYDLETLKKCTEKNINLLIFFLKYKFKENLEKISKCKPLIELVNDVFNFFYMFLNEEEKIYTKKNGKFLLLIEDHIVECFKYFEKRILSRRFYSITLDEVLSEIKSKLVFKNFDFSYLIEYFPKKMNEQNEKFLEKAREEIKKIIREFLA